MSNPKHQVVLPAVIAIVAIVVVVTSLAINFFMATRLFRNPSDFGEMFGAATALFTGLAFAGVVYTLVLQQRDLSHHRLEFEQSMRATTAAALFEYCNQKIGSLQRGVVEEQQNNKPDTEKIKDYQNTLKGFLQIHEKLRDHIGAYLPGISFPKQTYRPGLAHDLTER